MRILWDAKNHQELETWGLHLLHFRWMRFIPFMAKATVFFITGWGSATFVLSGNECEIILHYNKLME